MKRTLLFKTSRRCLALILTCLAFNQTIFAQGLTGTKNIGIDYASMAQVITELNTNGVGAGGVTINVPAYYTEILTSALILTATGTQANPIVFKKSGFGDNPKITAYQGTQLATATTFVDVIWAFEGSDYVTVDGIDLMESAGNTDATMQMEVGYGFYKVSATDGCNNNTVKNCTVTLNRNNTTAAAAGPRQNGAGSVGMELINSTRVLVGTAITVSSASGASSNNKFYANTIQNCHFGMVLSGFAAPSPYALADLNNDIGGADSLTGNKILNFGGGTGGACGAILINNQWSFNISYNIINNNDGNGINHTGTNRGIWLFASSNGANCNITHNYITIAAGTITGTSWTVDVEMSQGAAGNTINISNNKFLNCSAPSGYNNTSNPYTLIWVNTTASIVNIDSNYVYGFSFPGTTTSAIFYNSSNNSKVIGKFNIRNNTIDSTVLAGTTNAGSHYHIFNQYNITDTLTIVRNNFTRTILDNASAAGAKTVYFIYNTGTTPVVNVTDNIIDNFTRNGTTGGTTIGIYLASGTKHILKRNTISNMSISGSGTASSIYGMQFTTSTTVECEGNTISGLKILKTTGTGILYGIYRSTTTATDNINNNTIYDLVHNGVTTTTGATVYGIYTASAGTKTFSNNTINNLSGPVDVSGIVQSTGASAIFNNRIYNITTNSTAANIVSGIVISSLTASSTSLIYNNLVSGLNAPSSAGGTTFTVRGISLTNSAATTSCNVYNNTIYVNAASTGASSSTGIYHAFNTTATTNALDLRNNIIVNATIPNAPGLATAIARSASTNLNNFAAASNNNLLYVAPATSGSIIYYDGINRDSLLADYQSRVTPREAASVTESPNFLSTVGSSPLFLMIDSTIATKVESGGISIASVTNDILGNIRAGSIGYTGASGAPDIGAYEENMLSSAAPMTFDNADADQTTIPANALAGASNAQILRVKINCSNVINALQATAFQISIAGTTNPADITSIKVYATGNSSTFSTAQLFGSGSPSGLNITGTKTLGAGANYFWVTFDLAPSTTNGGNTLDAGVDFISITNNGNVPLITSAPAGSVTIKNALNGNKTVGVGGDYTTLTLAATDLAFTGVNGPVTLTLTDALYNATSGEIFPIVFNKIPGASGVNTVTILPGAGVAARIEGSATSVLDLSGATYLSIDGRSVGNTLPVTGTSLSVANISTTGSAIRFINDAYKNQVLYADLRAKNTTAMTSAGAGVVNFATTTGTIGNDSNLISHCSIHAETGGNPAVAIFTAGSATGTNDANTIEYCAIYDYAHASAVSGAVYVGANSNKLLVNNNHFYQTASVTSSQTHRIIQIGATGKGHRITNNFFGGNDSLGNGTYFATCTGTSTAGQIIVADFTLSSGDTSLFEGNTITNMNLTSSYANSASAVFVRVSTGGDVVIRNNLFGSRTINGSIVLNPGSAVSGLMGLMAIQAPQSVTINSVTVENNIISGIDFMNNVAATSGWEFFGGALASTKIITVTNNLIGDTLLANSLNFMNGTNGAPRVQGFLINPTNLNVANSVYTFTGNTIANFNVMHSNATVKGIILTAATDEQTQFTISNNTIRNLVTTSKNTGNATTNNIALAGILLNYPTALGNISVDVTGNRIENLVLKASGGAANNIGISVNSPAITTSIANISNNKIVGQSLEVQNDSAIITGIEIANGISTIANNMISMGLDSTGAGIMGQPAVRGIVKSGAVAGNTNYVYHNTIVVGGNTTYGLDTAKTFAFLRTGSGIDTVENNIFYNVRNNTVTPSGNYAVGASNNTTLVMNNNLLKGDSAGLYNGTPLYTVNDWYTLSNQDANSVNTAVSFVSIGGNYVSRDLHLTGASIGNQLLGGTPISAVPTDFDGQTRNSIKPYIGADENASALPVSLTTFTASAKGNDVLLSWRTASELNNLGFEIERSLDGHQFEKVAFVKGAGSSNMATQYSFTDSKAFLLTKNAVLYYRLKQSDFNGKYDYSTIVRVGTISKEFDGLSVSPNPYTSEYSVLVNAQNSGTASIEMMDIQGKIVATKMTTIIEGNNTIAVNEANQLQTGIYFVRLNVNGEVQTLKLIKN